MAEIGLVQLAELTLQVSEQVLPRYRSKCSKHQFTQPQLLAILCLMRYEDWTCSLTCKVSSAHWTHPISAISHPEIARAHCY